MKKVIDNQRFKPLNSPLKPSTLTLKKIFSLLLATLLIWNFNLNSAVARTIENRSITPYLEQVKNNITEFTLNNGLKFILLENHQAPIISFVTYVDVGGVDEPQGQTGVAHYLEHLAFKGTSEIGTINYEQEKPLLDKLAQLFDQIQQAKKENNQPKLAQLETEFRQVNQQASEYVNQNEFGQIVEIEGGVGLNAATSADYTAYFYNFPSNKLELWMYLESNRFLDPVFREFYQEKDVILEERRLRTDNSAIGKMVEEFLLTAFVSHPYRRPVIGFEEDIRNLTQTNVQDFFDTHYGGGNITIAMVGDVNPNQAREMAEEYFGRFPDSVKPSRLSINEPEQNETREVVVEYPSQPLYFEGYHIPSLNDPDYLVYEIMGSILSDGRTSRLYKSLVEDKKVALSVSGFSGFPGDKYENLMLFYGVCAPERSPEELAIELDKEIEKLKTELVSPEELERVKTQATANLLRSVNSNGGMANLLAEYQAKTGDWRNLFTRLDALNAVTAEDIQTLAQKTFTDEHKTIGKLETAS
ncbi:insulinase family protein [Cyanobacterium stanieri LEGE 03274]|uniref:Insulinase family protein n=1 Tax=Cyanobacterium stanieri LEGE 03274 TaxID=1828756 RepID=A0ABR9V2K5_9CHRO|nr:pitrilysin family protein [Cyanobacterium stanieri]MBE9222110.1 insulinase family protein [Cyanobacterium stanieri LEGE 03274]